MSLLKTSIKRALLCAGLMVLANTATAQEFRVGVLVTQNDDQIEYDENNDNQALLIADPITKHSFVIELYLNKINKGKEEKDQIKASDLTIRWAGELELVENKITKANEMSGLVYGKDADPKLREKASIKYLERFIEKRAPHLADKNIQYMTSIDHLSILLVSLSALRHDIPVKIAAAIMRVTYGITMHKITKNTEPYSEELEKELFLTYLNDLMSDIKEVEKYCPTVIEYISGFKKYTQELIELVELNKPLDDFRDNKMDNMLEELTKFQHLDNLSFIEVNPSPVISKVRVPMKPMYVGETELVEMLQAYTGNHIMEDVSGLTKEFIKNIADSGAVISQLQADMIFRSGLYEYLENRIDVGNNKELLLILGSMLSAANATNDINLDTAHLLKIGETFAETYSVDFIGSVGEIKDDRITDLYNKIMTMTGSRIMLNSKQMGNIPIIKN